MTDNEITWWGALLPVGKPLEDGRSIHADARWHVRPGAPLRSSGRDAVGRVDAVCVNGAVVEARGVVWDPLVAIDMATGKLRPAVDIEAAEWIDDQACGPIDILAVTLSDAPAWPDARFEIESA